MGVGHHTLYLSNIVCLWQCRTETLYSSIVCLLLCGTRTAYLRPVFRPTQQRVPASAQNCSITSTHYVPVAAMWDITSTQCMPVAESITIPTVCLWKYEWHIPSTDCVSVAVGMNGTSYACGMGYEYYNTHCVPVAGSMSWTSHLPTACLWQG